MRIPLPPAWFGRVLLWIWGVMVVAGVIAEVVGVTSAPDSSFWLLSLSYEHNIPTWYASCLLFLCGLLLTLISLQSPPHGPPMTKRWRILAGLFFYISVDEAVGFHEHMSDWIDAGGVLYFSWIIPAGVILLGLAFLFWRFVWALPPLTRRRFIVAGTIFVAGGFFIELPLGYIVELKGGDDNLAYGLVDAVGETLELLGTSLFANALLAHLHALCTNE